MLDAPTPSLPPSAAASLKQAGPRWELYRLLSEPVRLRLLALAAEEELAIGELAELLGESQPNVSRHAAPLKQAGLLVVRKQGTRALVRLPAEAAADAVVADALASGRALCEADGSLGRVADVLRARDAVAREFFARAEGAVEEEHTPGDGRTASEIGAYLSALAPLLPHRALAVDAGCGDGGLLDVLSPTFERVVAIDRSEAQLARARTRVASRAFRNVELVEGELDADAVKRAIRGHKTAKHDAAEASGADVVFAVRLLHHAPRPAHFVRQLADLCRPGGALIVIDYGHHDDESMRAQADLWLGFAPDELRGFAEQAGLSDVQITRIPSALCGRGPDAHLPWQVMVARKSDAHATLARRSDAQVSEKASKHEKSRQVRRGKGTNHG